MRWRIAPVLLVSDVAASMNWWRDILGFAVLSTFKNPPVMAFVERNGTQVMLQGNGGEIPGTNRAFMPGIWGAHVWVEDADALQAELAGRGAAVSEVHDTFYGNREFEVEDPDGYIIAFGSPTMHR